MTDDLIRVLVVDDHPVYREGLVGVFAEAPALVVVGTAADGPDAVREAERLQPDVVLMDVNLPTLSGIEATRTIVRASPHIAVLVLTMVDDHDAVFAAMRAGARGYLLKGATPEEIVRAAVAVAAGDAVFGSGIAGRVLAYFSAERTRGASAEAFPTLTAREREVLELIASGARNQEIARELYVSPKTVRNHISNIFTKLHVADRDEAIALARDAGVGREDQR
ncbi:response regulator [Agromyces binzhouensis]|uniref:Response regulator transcription factor n=1 Tax=Agromyces binzhouensis TaxID=1817495 RepID=A0A4V1QRF3_9MICO|nr:response regulator transcription factor [Agromyces binzhouensis]RXZ44693.1 response regulator transcription factor [Agromyces binzhouensis]